ncbi:MaoC family dehydratase [Streptomyces diacarni]|uniref:MaoC family dehydratase n=1 Tax=Streptomyces diacarni TaxID=2800381 RepID=UPI0033D3BE51
MCVGEVLPDLPIPVTRTLIVATALASRDYQDVHHDPDLARERGSRDIFMNILTSNGLVDRYVTEWAGPAAVVEAIRIRLGVPNHPGDTMVLTGAVTAKTDEGRRVEIAVRGTNSLGAHVTGTVAVRLPSTGGASPDTAAASASTATASPDTAAAS